MDNGSYFRFDDDNKTKQYILSTITRGLDKLKTYSPIMASMVSQITSLTIVYLAVYSGADQRKHQNSVSLAFVRGIHQGPVNSPHKWPVTRKMFPFDDVIMNISQITQSMCSRGMCKNPKRVILTVRSAAAIKRNFHWIWMTSKNLYWNDWSRISERRKMIIIK